MASNSFNEVSTILTPNPDKTRTKNIFGHPTLWKIPTKTCDGEISAVYWKTTFIPGMGDGSMLGNLFVQSPIMSGERETWCDLPLSDLPTSSLELHFPDFLATGSPFSFRQLTGLGNRGSSCSAGGGGLGCRTRTVSADPSVTTAGRLWRECTPRSCATPRPCPQRGSPE